MQRDTLPQIEQRRRCLGVRRSIVPIQEIAYPEMNQKVCIRNDHIIVLICIPQSVERAALPVCAIFKNRL